MSAAGNDQRRSRQPQQSAQDVMDPQSLPRKQCREQGDEQRPRIGDQSRFDQGDDTGVLQMDLALVETFVLFRCDVPESAQGHFAGLDLTEHLAQEQRIAAGPLGQVGAQFAGEDGIAPDGLKVEKDIGKPESDEISLPHPHRDLFEPLRKSLPPQRVDRHAIAGAVGEARIVEPVAHPFRQLAEIGVDAQVLVVGVGADDEAVVLIGEQVVLTAPARSHDHDRHRSGKIAPTVKHHLSAHAVCDAAVHLVVDAGQHPLHLRGGVVVVQQGFDQLGLRRLDVAGGQRAAG